jgi:pyridoxine 5-phosphate synthase
MLHRELGFRINAVAQLRQFNASAQPDPVAIALLAEQAGASQTHVHLRQDRKHIQERDVRILREVLQGGLNLEMGPSQEITRMSHDVKPDSVTIVPEMTGDTVLYRGLNIGAHRDQLKKHVQSLGEVDIDACFLIEPDIDQVRLAHHLKIAGVELYAGRYALARGAMEKEKEWLRIDDAAKVGAKLGMRVCVGHGLTLQNLPKLAQISDIHQFNVGHALLSGALIKGVSESVRDFLALIRA